MFARLFARWRRPRTRIELRLFTRASCPLCEEMKSELARARVRPPFELVEVDVERDAQLLARHGQSVPVLEIAGRPAFKGRLTTAEFERKYARRVAELASEAGGEASARGARDG